MHLRPLVHNRPSKSSGHLQNSARGPCLQEPRGSRVSLAPAVGGTPGWWAMLCRHGRGTAPPTSERACALGLLCGVSGEQRRMGPLWGAGWGRGLQGLQGGSRSAPLLALRQG